jgi:hypothetical protein
MSLKAAPCTRRPGVRRVCAADALVTAVPRLVWAGRLAAETQSIKSAIRIMIAAVDIFIYGSDVLLRGNSSLQSGHIKAGSTPFCG